jgi:acetyltransferase-like isoleucine patch superfamily enzyme
LERSIGDPLDPRRQLSVLGCQTRFSRGSVAGLVRGWQPFRLPFGRLSNEAKRASRTRSIWRRFVIDSFFCLCHSSSPQRSGLMRAVAQRAGARLRSAIRSGGIAGVVKLSGHYCSSALGLLGMVWARAWMHFAGLGFLGRIANRLAGLFSPPFFGRIYLASLSPRGYVAPTARIHHSNFQSGPRAFIGDRVLIYQDKGGGFVRLGEAVHLYGDISMLTGSGGSIEIGAHSHIQPRCQFSAYLSPIRIGRNVEIAPNCAFYPYDHGIEQGALVSEQPSRTKGGIFIGDGAWLGFGVIVLDGVRIGRGAVVAAGSIVMHDLPDDAVAFGSPARVVKMRVEVSHTHYQSGHNRSRDRRPW